MINYREKKMGKLTKHGKIRIQQRVNNYNSYNGLLFYAKQNGLSHRYYTGEFYQYLYRKTLKGCKVKVYNSC